MSKRSVIHEGLERFARAAGMEKKSGTWYRQGDEVVAVVDLQKSQYGQQYYLNLGFWLRELGADRYPKGLRCHISVRLETLAPEERHRIARLLDLDHEIPDEQRVDELVALLNERTLPLIERGSSVVGLRALVDEGALRAAAIRGPAQQVLAAA